MRRSRISYRASDISLKKAMFYDIIPMEACDKHLKKWKDDGISMRQLSRSTGVR